MRLRLPTRTASRRRRTIAVIVVLVAMIVAALFASWIFWVGVAVFALVATVDLFFPDRPLE